VTQLQIMEVSRFMCLFVLSLSVLLRPSSADATDVSSCNGAFDVYFVLDMYVLFSLCVLKVNGT